MHDGTTPVPLTTGRSEARAAAADPAAHTLVCDDGRHLAATWHEPVGPARAVALVSAATGAPRGFYRGFAQWLAGRGYAVLTYDYRGIGGSRRGPMRQETASMRDWALLDMSAALAAAQARRQRRLPLLLVGHSFGGNGIAFARGVEQADALLMVAAQHGEARLFDGRHRLLAEVYFRALLPAAVALHGHAPRWASRGEALPREVARDWWRWGLTPGWACADPRMAPYRQASGLVCPVHLWSIDDDRTYGAPRAVDALAAQFRNAAVQRHHLHPREVGAQAIGHFGAFRREPGPRLWQRLLAPVEAAAPELRLALG
ncbi:MAG: alpha/beta fold hydrolase [Pseudomonadota bacterium]